MKKPSRLALLLFLAFLAIDIQAQIWTPQVGDPQREGILNMVRPYAQADLGGSVKFVVEVIQTDGRWAYLQAVPQRPNGQPIDWEQTRFGLMMREGMMSDVIMALLQRSGDSWQVVDYIFGPTDVYWYGWMSRYGLPKALFMRQ